MAIKISPKLEKLLKEYEPNFAHQNQRFEINDLKEVGTSFEPRMRIRYKVYFNGKYKGIYEHTLVLSKGMEHVESVINGKWI